MDPKKKKIAEEIEKVMEMGQDSEERGVKVTGQVFKEEKEKERADNLLKLEMLGARRKYKDYNGLLAKFCKDYLDEEDMEQNVRYTVGDDGTGVVMLIAYGKRVFQRAFRPSYDPIYDLNACKMFAISCSSLISKLKDGYSKSQQETLNQNKP
jgi:hypothetical protein